MFHKVPRVARLRSLLKYAVLEAARTSVRSLSLDVPRILGSRGNFNPSAQPRAQPAKRQVVTLPRGRYLRSLDARILGARGREPLHGEFQSALEMATQPTTNRPEKNISPATHACTTASCAVSRISSLPTVMYTAKSGY